MFIILFEFYNILFTLCTGPTTKVFPQRVKESVVLEAPLPKRIPLYRRLHGCIQAAASKVKDFTAKRCTKRVEILVNLIPKDFAEDLGNDCYIDPWIIRPNVQGLLQ